MTSSVYCSGNLRLNDCNVISGIEMRQPRMDRRRMRRSRGETRCQRRPRCLHPVAQDVDARLLAFGESHF